MFIGLAIYNNKCENSTENSNHCRPPQEIDSIVQGGYYLIMKSNYYVTADDYKTPLKREIDESFNVMNSGISVELNYNVKPLNLNSDDGFISQNLKYYSGFEWTVDYFYHMEKSNNILKFGFGGWSSGDSYFRVYSKFQEALAQVGALVKTLSPVTNIIVKFISRKYFYLDSFFKTLNLMKIIVVQNN